MPTARIFIERAPIGWRYSIDVAEQTVSGWRPTRKWALKAARQRGHLEDTGGADVNS